MKFKFGYQPFSESTTHLNRTFFDSLLRARDTLEFKLENGRVRRFRILRSSPHQALHIPEFAHMLE